jgi:YjbE family integral membrane protein
MDLFFSIFANDLAALGTYAGISALITIILIDIVMSGDNAILIGMATKNLTGELRKKAIFWGVAGATVLRIIFSLGVVYLLQIPGLEFAGALLLLYVVWKFYREIRATEHGVDTHAGPVDTTFRAAIQTIIIADVVMSLDNVLAVAGASHGNVVNLII